MNAISAVFKFFQDGGFFMYPIGMVFAIGVAISLERYIYLTREHRNNRALWLEIEPLVISRRFREAFASASNSTAGISRMLSYGLARANHAKKLAEIASAMEEGLMESMPKLEKRTHYLSTYANIATLTGLLGTVVGLIEAFTAVANADPLKKAEMLSSAISVGMNTTAFGLMVAIPLMLIFTFLQSKTNEIIDHQDMVSVKFLNIVSTNSGLSD
jgi:biopolymer transport protein ExbB/TolQ